MNLPTMKAVSSALVAAAFQSLSALWSSAVNYFIQHILMMLNA